MEVRAQHAIPHAWILPTDHPFASYSEFAGPPKTRPSFICCAQSSGHFTLTSSCNRCGGFSLAEANTFGEYEPLLRLGRRRKRKLLVHPITLQCPRGGGLQTLDSSTQQESVTREGLSCLYVGPLETARKERLEALYQQARDSYYSGQPLIIDDMFDKVEAKLRWYGSKLVLKYPRCSLRRLSAYADAEVDPSQVWALGSIWFMLFASGFIAATGPAICALNNVCRDSICLRFTSHSISATSEGVMMASGLFGTAMGILVGIPIATAAARALQNLLRGDLVALKGYCPNCGEEVYAFVHANNSMPSRHKTECHICEHPLVFHVKVERTDSSCCQPWAYGRIYLVRRPQDLIPQSRF